MILILVHFFSGSKRGVSHFRRQQEPMDQQIQFPLTYSTLLSWLYKSSISHKPAHQKPTCDGLAHQQADQDLKSNSCMGKLNDFLGSKEGFIGFHYFHTSSYHLWLLDSEAGLCLFDIYHDQPNMCSQTFSLFSSIFREEFVSGVNHAGDRH